MSDTKSSATRRPAIAPGRLRNYVEMTIQTRQAQRLVHGRRGGEGTPPIIGLYRFGAMTRTIWSGASKDDPYADWQLLQIEEALVESKDELTAMRQTIDQDMERVSAMKVGLAQSQEPIQIELTFSNPYGYMGAWLLVDMDELVLAALTARHVGLVTRDDSEKLLQQAGRAVRRAFAAAQGYRFTALTRSEVRHGTRRSKRAKQAMGILPQAVLDGTLRAEHAPAIAEARAEDKSGHTVANAKPVDPVDEPPLPPELDDEHDEYVDDAKD